MREEIPAPPFRDRERMAETPLAEEIKAILATMVRLTLRLRAKNPEDPTDVDKSPEDTNESIGDHTAMTAYLMDYFHPLIKISDEKGERLELNYERSLDMVLAHDLGDVTNLPPIPGVQKSPEQREQELISTAKIFGELPSKGGFNKNLFEAYAEYLGEETREARFVRAINGLSTMLYVLSKPHHLRKGLVGGKGYALEDYRDRVGNYCREFGPVNEFYTLVERLFRQKEYFAESRVYQNHILRPNLARKILTDKTPDFGDPDTTNVEEETSRLLRLQTLKWKLRFGKEAKPDDEYHDTVAEHVSSLLFLAKYFTPIVRSDPEQKNAQFLDYKEIVGMIFVHDMPEALTGDVVSGSKDEKRSLEEWDAGVEMSTDFVPRAGRYDKRFWNYLEKYELERTKSRFVTASWFVKTLDQLEGELHKYARGKQPHEYVMSLEEAYKKALPNLELFPLLHKHFVSIQNRSRHNYLR